MRAVLIVGLVATITSCGLRPESVSRNDPRLTPLFEAMSRVDRASMGFTDVSTDASIRLEHARWGKKPYDAMLHVYAKTSRTVAFRRSGRGYEWIGEQEIFKGPKRYTTPDGEFNEEIMLNFDKVSISGFPVNTLIVEYSGPDSTLAWPHKLSLGEARPILSRWGY